jgi:hypothetical protein
MGHEEDALCLAFFYVRTIKLCVARPPDLEESTSYTLARQ